MLVTKSDYAKIKGVSKPAISQAIRYGRIQTINGMIDIDAADAQLQETTKINRHDGMLSDMDISSRAKRERHEANIAEMKERKMAGELVELKTVMRLFTDLAVQLRRSLESIPDKLAERIAAEQNPSAVYDMLLSEIDAALADMAEMVSRIPDAVSDGDGN